MEDVRIRLAEERDRRHGNVEARQCAGHCPIFSNLDDRVLQYLRRTRRRTTFATASATRSKRSISVRLMQTMSSKARRKTPPSNRSSPTALRRSTRGTPPTM